MREFLDDLKRHGYAQGNFLGLLHVLIGRRLEKVDGKALWVGLTCRDPAPWRKKVRGHRDPVRELGLEPATPPPRDRQRYWYTAISTAKVDSPEATAAGDRLAEKLK